MNSISLRWYRAPYLVFKWWKTALRSTQANFQVTRSHVGSKDSNLRIRNVGWGGDYPLGRKQNFWKKKKFCETGYRESRGGQARPIRVGADCGIHKETQPAARRVAEGGPRVGGSHFSSNPNWDGRRRCAFAYRALFFSLTFSGRKSLGLPPATIQCWTNKKCQPLARSPLPGTCGGPPAQPQRPAWGRGRPGASPEVPVAAVKSWALSAAGRSVGRGVAVTAGKGTERGPRARCASLSCGTCTRDSARTPAARGTAGGGKGGGGLFSPSGGVRPCASVSPAVSGPRSLQLGPESIQINCPKARWKAAPKSVQMNGQGAE